MNGQLLGASTPHSLDTAKEVLRGHLQNEVQENSKTHSEVLGHLQYLATKSSGACQTRAHGTFAHGVLFLGYGMGHGPCPTSVITTRSAI
jgi:hypothetical protein